MTEEINTKPTLETILERINAVAEQVTAVQKDLAEFRESVSKELVEFRESMSKEMAVFRQEIEERLDDIEKQTTRTRMDMLNLRNDFRELRGQFKETSPA